MKGRCPASGTVVPADRRETRGAVAKCPGCERYITFFAGASTNFEPTFRNHVARPAPTAASHYADGVPR